MRTVPTLAFLVALAACQATSPCVEPRLELHCYHSEHDRGPVDHEDAEPCEPPAIDGPVETCGAYEVVAHGGGYTSTTHFFEGGEHIATAHTTDVSIYCGGSTFWYGQKVQCDPEVDAGTE